MALLVYGFNTALWAANWYVRAGATGVANGADWNNAWTDVVNINWNSVKPGDSVWIAGSTNIYGTLTVQSSGVTNQPIYIARVRSTNSVPAAAAGWNPSYDSTVTLNRVSSWTSFWILDGQLANGIVVTNNNVTSYHGIDFGQTGASYVKLVNLLISGVATNQSMSGIGDTRCVNLNYSTGGPAGHGLYIGYCTLQQYPTLISTLNMSGMTVEHCLLRRNYAGNSGNHPNIWQSIGGTNIVFRFNEITEQLTEGIMMDFVSTNDAPNDSWDIYGNLWHDPVTNSYSRIVETQERAQYRIRLYNNTFVNVYYGVSTAGGSWGAGCSSENNIFFLATAAATGFGQGADDYNLSSESLSGTHSIGGASTNVFVNYAAANYHIVGTIGAAYPRGKGLALGAPYNIDMAGNLRGTNGNWDIGACQAVGPSSPSSLRVVGN